MMQWILIQPNGLIDNIVVWDGNPQTWQPPQGYTAAPYAEMDAKIWVLKDTDYVIEPGRRWPRIGDTLVNNVIDPGPKPQYTPPTQPQPQHSGAQDF